MFTKAAFDFLRDLEANNNRDWFQPRKDDYARLLKDPFAHVLYGVTERLRDTDLPLSGSEATMFRVNRDVRFSKDKRPYQTHVSGLLTRSGMKDMQGAAAYLQLDGTGGMFVAGVYQPPPEPLAAIRHRIVAQPDRFLGLVADLSAAGLPLDMSGGLVRMPKGFEEQANSPVAAHLRLKSFFVERKLTPAVWLDGSVMDIAAESAVATAPLFRFLDV